MDKQHNASDLKRSALDLLEERIIKLSQNHKILYTEYSRLLDQKRQKKEGLISINHQAQNQSSINILAKSEQFIRFLELEQEQLQIEKKELEKIRMTLNAPSGLKQNTSIDFSTDRFTINIIKNLFLLTLIWGVAMGFYLINQQERGGYLVVFCCLILLGFQKFIIQVLKENM